MLAAQPLAPPDYVAVLGVIATCVGSAPQCALQFLRDGGLGCVAQLLRLLPPARLRIDVYLGVMRLVCALTGSTPPPEYDTRGASAGPALPNPRGEPVGGAAGSDARPPRAHVVRDTPSWAPWLPPVGEGAEGDKEVGVETWWAGDAGGRWCRGVVGVVGMDCGCM